MASEIVAQDRHVPVEYVGEIEANYHCRGWNPRRVKYCHHRAGAGTVHLGHGRCAFHGGVKRGDKRIKTGTKSKQLRKAGRILKLRDMHLANPDPLNLMTELALLRALCDDYRERFEDTETFDHQAFASLLEQVTKAAKKIEDVAAQNAISRHEFFRIMTQMGQAMARILNTYLSDIQVRERAKRDLKQAWDGILVSAA